MVRAIEVGPDADIMLDNDVPLGDFHFPTREHNPPSSVAFGVSRAGLRDGESRGDAGAFLWQLEVRRFEGWVRLELGLSKWRPGRVWSGPNDRGHRAGGG